MQGQPVLPDKACDNLVQFCPFIGLITTIINSIVFSHARGGGEDTVVIKRYIAIYQSKPIIIFFNNDVERNDEESSSQRS